MVEERQGVWCLLVDGASRGNPGQAGCGAAIYDGAGTVVEELSRYLGSTTNNVAEYQGLLIGLEGVIRLGGKRVQIRSDSELLVRQLNGIYRVRDEKLKGLYKKALGLLGRLEDYRIVHVPRDHNRLADRLANRAIDEAPDETSQSSR